MKPIHGPQAKNIEFLPRIESVLIGIKPGHELGVWSYYLLARLGCVFFIGIAKAVCRELEGV